MEYELFHIVSIVLNYQDYLISSWLAHITRNVLFNKDSSFRSGFNSRSQYQWEKTHLFTGHTDDFPTSRHIHIDKRIINCLSCLRFRHHRLQQPIPPPPPLPPPLPAHLLGPQIGISRRYIGKTLIERWPYRRQSRDHPFMRGGGGTSTVKPSTRYSQYEPGGWTPSRSGCFCWGIMTQDRLSVQLGFFKRDF
jgi:hypothetical protein